MIFAGGVLSWLVTIPMIKFFGAGLEHAIFPGTVLIREMDSFAIWRAYIRPIGAGAVATAGLFTLGRTLPTIVRALRSTFQQLRKTPGGAEPVAAIRTERNCRARVVFGGSLAMILIVWAVLAFPDQPGGQRKPGGLHPGGGFWLSFRDRVGAHRRTDRSLRQSHFRHDHCDPDADGPALCRRGLDFGAYPAVAISIGGIVCIAAAVGGATSQSLKAGFLVEQLPGSAEMAMIVGALTSVLVIGFTLVLLNRAYTRVEPLALQNVQMTAEMRVVGEASQNGKTYQVINVIGSHAIPDGRYYYDPADQAH